MALPAEGSVMPGGGISRRPLHLFLLADCSGSMKVDGKMQALNFAIGSMLPVLASWEKEQEQAQLFIRAISFANDAQWHIEDAMPVRQARWVPLSCVDKGLTSMGAAFRLLAAELTPEKMEARALRPAIVLITDGRPTDPADFESGLQALKATRAGKSALRLAVAIGRGANSEYLTRFIDNPDVPVLVADGVEQITDQLVAASLALSRMSQVGADPRAIALLPPPATAVPSGDADTIV